MCKTSLNFYLLPNNTCTLTSGFPPAHGINSLTGKADPCQVPNCLVCLADYQACDACNTSSGHYWLTATSCIAGAASPAEQGPNLVSGKIEACSDSLCLRCRGNHSECEECEAGKYVYKKGCVDLSAGIGRIAAESGVLKAEDCKVQNCEDCSQDSSIC